LERWTDIVKEIAALPEANGIEPKGWTAIVKSFPVWVAMDIIVVFSETSRLSMGSKD